MQQLVQSTGQPSDKGGHWYNMSEVIFCVVTSVFCVALQCTQFSQKNSPAYI